MKTQHEIDGQHLLEALKIARERVTADSIAVKQARRDQFKVAIDAMYHYLDTGEARPSAEALRLLLGDPEDKATRAVLDGWE